MNQKHKKYLESGWTGLDRRNHWFKKGYFAIYSSVGRPWRPILTGADHPL